MARQARRPVSRRPSGGKRSRADARREKAANAAREHLKANRLEAAREALAPLLTPRNPYPDALFLAGVLAERQGAWPEAGRRVRQFLRLQPPGRRPVEALLLLARTHRVRAETDAALALCEEVLAARPDYPNAVMLKAQLCEESGRRELAWETIGGRIETCRAAGRPVPPGWLEVEAKLLVQEKRYDEALARTDELLAMPNTNAAARSALFHLQAKAHDRAGNFDEAWNAAERANAIGRVEFDPSLYASQLDTLMDTWNAEDMAKFPRSSVTSELPVFVAGMPRSGTSLIDQIIDAHPLAAGVGELADLEKFAAKVSLSYDPDLEPPACFGDQGQEAWDAAAQRYVEDVRGKCGADVQRVVNKSLGNNRLVGMLARLFPHTRIIHAIRDPRDVAVSCFMGGFNNNLIAWTTRVEWAAAAWEQSMRVMQHWKDTLDVPILDVHYEDLVADPEPQFRRIIDFLGLPWDEACMSFHKSRRTVRTLSYDQVNRPIYKSSSGRHANYAEQIAPIDFPPYR